MVKPIASDELGSGLGGGGKLLAVVLSEDA